MPPCTSVNNRSDCRFRDTIGCSQSPDTMLSVSISVSLPNLSNLVLIQLG